MVPAVNPVKVDVEPDPVFVVPPGEAVRVHAPTGKPFRTTLPVELQAVGWVMAPTTGAEGTTGCAFTTAVPEADDVHPEAAKTVKV